MAEIRNRPGTVSLGEEYEVLVPAFLGLKLLENTEIEDFNFKNNINGFGAFDDLIVFIKLTNGTKYNFALQLKHKENKRKLQIDALEALNGEFSLRKYQETFIQLERCYYVILFTNLELDLEKARKMKKFKAVKNEKCPGRDFFNTNQKTNSIYRFKELGNRNGKYLDFFNNFSLYVTQKNLHTLETSVRDVIVKKYYQNSQSADNYINYFRNWRLKNFQQKQLTMEHIKVQLFRLLLSPHIAQPCAITTQIDPRYTIIEKSIKQFDVTIANNLSVSFIIKHWKKDNDEDNQILCDIGKQNNFIVKNAECLTIEDKQEIQCFYQQLPMIIKFDNNNATHSIFAALNLYKKGRNNPKLLLVGKNVAEKFVMKNYNLTTFYHLSDLFQQNKNLYFTLVQTFRISLQGRRKIYLKELINLDENVASLLTVSELIKLLDEDYFVGEAKETLPDHYIRRKVSKICFSIKHLLEIKNDILVVTTNSFVSFIKMIAKDYVIDVDEYLNGEKTHVKNVSEKIFIVKIEKFSNQECNEIIRRNKDRNIHFFEVTSNEDVEWINTHGRINELEKLSLSHKYLKEKRIYQCFRNNLNIICARPGTGKSTLMKYLRNNCPSTHWVIMVELKEHGKLFQEEHSREKALEYILEENSKEFRKDSISLELRQLFLKYKMIQLFWDGVDELPGDQVEKAIDIIKDFQKNGYSQWVSSRTILKSYIEHKLSVLSTCIKDYTIEEQERYITLRLHINKTPEQITEIIAYLYRNIVGSYLCLNNEILGVPLLLYIITEILLQNPYKSPKLIEELSVLSCMYRNFMIGKLKHYLSKRHTNPESLRALVDDCELVRFKMYQAVAVKSCFKSEILKNVLNYSALVLLNNDQNLFIEQFRKNGDYLGVVVRVNDDNTALFAHHSYAEFFTAWWMTLHIKEIFNFKTFIFEKQFDNIRYFFDMLLGEKSPSHIAVLYNECKMLKKCIVSKSLQEDEAGRTPLHLACSWGKRHPLLQLDNPIHKFSLCKLFQNPIPFYRSYTQTYEDNYNVKIVKLLSDWCDPFKIDTVYGLSAIMYADETLLISALEGISASHTVNMNKLKNFSDIHYVAYYSIDNNYYNLFQQILTNLPMFYIDFPYRTLYEHAIELQRVKLAKKILENKNYNRTIQNVSHIHEELTECLRKSYVRDLNFRYRLKDRAVFKPGSLDNLKNVISRNKKYINNYDFEGNTPLTLAAELGSISIIRQLVTENADTNQRNLKGQTAVCVAEICGFTIIVKYLEKRSNVLFNDVMKNPLAPYVREGDLEAIINLHKEDTWDISELQEFRQHALPNIVIKNQLEILRYFIKEGVDVNMCNKNKETVLMLSALRGHLEVTKILIEEGNANPNIVDKFGETALLKALKTDNNNIANYLLAKTQNVLQQNKFRENIFTICAEKGIHTFYSLANNIELYLQLLQKGILEEEDDRN